MDDHKKKKNLKQRVVHELIEYLINFTYMAIFFSAIIFYRRLILTEYGIYLNDYFIGVIKALIIAKVVMIAAFLRISQKFEHKPLIFPAIYKALFFTLSVMLFDIFEMFIRGLIHHPALTEVFAELKNHITDVWLGAALLIFLSFIPFFALKELSRFMGEKEISRLFFGKRVE